MENKLSIIIVNYNSRSVLIDCLNSVLSYTNKINYEVFVVDNNSSEKINDLVEKYESFKFIFLEKNVGFSAANNAGIKQSSGDLVLLLNPDTVVNSDSFIPMINLLTKDNSIGVVGCKLVNLDGTIENSTHAYPSLINEFFHANEFLKPLFGYNSNLLKIIQKVFKTNALSSYWDHNSEREVNHVTGAYMMIKREIIEKLGMLDEAFFLYNEEVEWCYRIKKAGYKIIYSPASSIIHHFGYTSEHKGRLLKYNWLLIEKYRGKLYFFKKHYSSLALFFYRVILFFSFSMKLALNYFLYFFSKEKSFIKNKIKVVKAIIRLSLLKDFDWHSDPENVIVNGQK